MGRPNFSDFIQRAINGLWVAWKPLMAPQAMVINRHGKMLFVVSEASPIPSQISGTSGFFTNSITINATAMNSSETANTGYTLPIILSIGIIVAMI